jgi:hypothetical protein
MMGLLDWLMPILVVILGAREFLPKAIRLFRPKLQDVYFEEDHHLELPDDLKEEVENCVNKLKTKGFSPIGTRIEKSLIWGSPQRELNLVSEADHIFACVYVERKMLKYYFYTPFSDGGIVISSFLAYKNRDKNGLCIYASKKDDLEEILNTHKMNVRNFIEKGFIPYKEYTWQSRLKATYLYYKNPFIRKDQFRTDLASLAILVICIIPLIIVVVFRPTVAPASP